MRKASFLLLSLLISIPLLGQSAFFNPYPLKLQATQILNEVIITWVDSYSFRGGEFKLFRHLEQITDENISSAILIGTIPFGVQRYVDTPPREGRYYYAITGVSETGEDYFQVAIYRNTLIDPVNYSPPPEVVREPIVPQSPEDEGTQTQRERAEIQFSITPDSRGVEIAFSANLSDRTYLLFRGTSPISNEQEVKDSILLESFTNPEGRYRDEPPPGLPFYYAVIDGRALNMGLGGLFQKNYSTEPFKRQLEVVAATMDTDRRRAPLPQIRLERELRTGDALTPTGLVIPPQASLSAEGDKALTSLAKVRGSQLPPPLPLFRLLPQEEGPNLVGRSQDINQVYRTFLQNKEWEEGIEALESLLTDGLEREWAQRTRFYLAQAYAFHGQFSKAVLEFITLEEVFPGEIKPWLESLYPRLQEQQKP